MEKPKKEIDKEKGDAILKRMLKTPPKINETLTKASAKKKPSDTSVKKHRSGNQ